VFPFFFGSPLVYRDLRGANRRSPLSSSPPSPVSLPAAPSLTGIPRQLLSSIESNPTDLDPRIDALTDQIRVEMNQEKRKALCSEVPKTPDEDLLTPNLADFNPTKR
jgi:hypothetical protein